MDPQFVQAYVNRGNAYLSLGQDDRAIQEYDDAIRLDPQFAIAYANRARTYTILGKDTEARQDVDRAVELGLDRSTLEGIIEDLWR